jgi:hypothetical protein
MPRAVAADASRVSVRARALVCACAAVVALAALPAAAHARFTVGVGDQRPGALSDPRLLALHLHQSRYVTPFDVALRHDFRRAQLDAWLAAARANHVRPLVAFYTDHHRKPTVARYRRAVRAFHAAYPQVRDLSTWNEVNLSVLSRDPRRAARFYLELRKLCRSCRVVAADVLDSSTVGRFLRAFRRVAPHARLWGLHNYLDVNYGRTSGTRRVLAAVPGEVWLTEVGGIISSRRRHFSTRRQATAVHRVFAIARRFRRIRRVYLYNWAGGRRTWDSGLIAPSGRARPALGALRSELRCKH